MTLAWHAPCFCPAIDGASLDLEVVIMRKIFSRACGLLLAGLALLPVHARASHPTRPPRVILHGGYQSQTSPLDSGSLSAALIIAADGISGTVRFEDNPVLDASGTGGDATRRGGRSWKVAGGRVTQSGAARTFLHLTLEEIAWGQDAAFDNGASGGIARPAPGGVWPRHAEVSLELTTGTRGGAFSFSFAGAGVVSPGALPGDVATSVLPVWYSLTAYGNLEPGTNPDPGNGRGTSADAQRARSGIARRR